MTKTERFLKQNQAFLQASFRSDEELVYAEEIRRGSPMMLAIPLIMEMLLGWFLTIAPLGVRLFIPAFMVYVFIAWLAMIASGICRCTFAVLTTRSIYLCRGIRGIVAFDCSLGGVRAVVDAGNKLLLIADEPCENIGKRWLFGASKRAAANYWKNIILRCLKKPPVDTICDISGIAIALETDGSGCAVLEVDIKKESHLYTAFQQLTILDKEVKFKRVKPVMFFSFGSYLKEI